MQISFIAFALNKIKTLTVSSLNRSVNQPEKIFVKPRLSVTIDNVLPWSNWRLNLWFHLVRTAANAQIVSSGTVYLEIPIIESQSALQSWSYTITCIGKEKLKHYTTEWFRKGLVVLSRQVH